MKKINGLKIIRSLNAQLNEQYDKEYGTGLFKGKNFTDSLQLIYKPVNEGGERMKEFLNQEIMDQEQTSKYMILNVYNRFFMLGTLLSIVDERIYDLFLGSNDFRTKLITNGGVVKVKNGRLSYFSYERFFFPTDPEFDADIDFELNDDGIETDIVADKENKEGEIVFDWPGCSVVLPKDFKVQTILNPKISFPSFYINQIEEGKQDFKSVSIFETNRGVDILQSEPDLVMTKESVQELEMSFLNPIKSDGYSYKSIDLILAKRLFEKGYNLILEVPFSTPRQDILTKISREGKDEAPIFFTFCT